MILHGIDSNSSRHVGERVMNVMILGGMTSIFWAIFVFGAGLNAVHIRTKLHVEVIHTDGRCRCVKLVEIRAGVTE